MWVDVVGGAELCNVYFMVGMYRVLMEGASKLNGSDANVVTDVSSM